MIFKILVGALCVCSAVFAGPLSMADEKKEGQAASVNGVVITNEDVNKQMSMLEEQMSSRGTAIQPQMVPALKDKILTFLIEQELLFQESRKQQIVVEDKEVSGIIDTSKADSPMIRLLRMNSGA
jgi:hypothetical protein